MAYNRRVKVKQLEVGFVMVVTLFDDNGDRLDLSDRGIWEVSFIVTVKDEDTLIMAGDMEPDADQTWNAATEEGHRGESTYPITSDDLNLPDRIEAGEYDLEITAIEPGGVRTHQFPKSDGTVFGTMEILQSK